LLGTGAADWPAKYPPVEQQFERGAVRGMCSMLVNGHILIDCGPTVLDAMNRYSVDPAAITDIVLTLTHADHFHPDSILTLASARNSELGPLRFWEHRDPLQRVSESNRVEQRPVEIGTTIEMHGFGIAGLKANHLVDSSNERCLLATEEYLLPEGLTPAFDGMVVVLK
jgi:ribonuclease BN (tRNA processing enzyme)